MEIEVLNNFQGDKVLKVDTGTADGRKKAADVLAKLFKAGTAIFLERADKTYRVTGYDPKTDRLLVGVHNRRITGKKCACGGCRGCDRNIASNNRSGVCTACHVNGRSSYFSHSSSPGGEVFFFKEDALEVRDEERRTLLRLAGDEEQRGRKAEAADWRARAKEVALIEVQMPPARVPSSNLRALRIADEEAARTGYLPTAKRMKEMLAQFYADDRRQGESGR